MLQPFGPSVEIIEFLRLGKNSSVIPDCLADLHMPADYYASSSLTTSSNFLESWKKIRHFPEKALKVLKKPCSN